MQNGSGRVYFGAGAVKEVIPDWWTTTSPNAYDEINSAIAAAVGASGSTLSTIGVELKGAEVYLSNPVTISSVAANSPIGAANVPAWIKGNNATIQAAPGSSGLCTLCLYQTKNNTLSSSTSGGLSTWSATGVPAFHIDDLLVNAAGLTQHALYAMGSPGDLTHLACTYATGDGCYFDSAAGKGMYYNTFTDLVSVANSGNGFYVTGTSLNGLYNNNNTFIHPQARSNLGNGFEIVAAQNFFLNPEAENNNGVGIHVRGSYTSTMIQNAWLETNHRNTAQSGAANNSIDIGVLAAGEPTDIYTTGVPVGITGLWLAGAGRSGYVLPWLTWTPNTAYQSGVNVIPPANSSCGSTNNLCFQAWAASTAYNAGDVVLPATQFNGNGRWYQATANCTSGTSEPAWTLTEGSITTGAGCTWTAHRIAYQVAGNHQGTSGASQPTWTYTTGNWITDGTVTWQVNAQNILASVGNWIWSNSGNAGTAPYMGPGGDLGVQSISSLSPMVLPNGSTATTQTPGDSSADAATDQFVAAAIAAAITASGSAHSKEFAMPGGQSQSVTNYCNTAGCTTSEGRAVAVAPAGLTASNLYCSVQSAPASGQTITFTLRSGNTLGTMTASSLSCQITSSGTTCSDTNPGHALTIAQGQYWDLNSVSSATSGEMFWSCAIQE